MKTRRLLILGIVALSIVLGLVFGFWFCDQEHEKLYRVYEFSLNQEENRK